jgi:hypothetical protein
MRKSCAAVVVILAMAVPVFAAKIEGTGTLKDSRPAGTPEKKKHQVYDLSFDAPPHSYTCRTDRNKSMNPTDFVVGDLISYEIDGQKVKIKAPAGKQVDCKVVRVEAIRPPAPAGSTPTPTAPTGPTAQ